MSANTVISKHSLLCLFISSFQLVSSLNLQVVKDKSEGAVNIPNAVQMLERLRTRLLEIAGDTTQMDIKYIQPAHLTTLK